MREASAHALVIRLRAGFTAIGCILTGVLLGWSPHWRSGASLVKISHLGLPWPVIGLAFVAAGVLVLIPSLRAIGYGLGAVLFLTAAWSLITVSATTRTANAPATVGLAMTGCFLVLGVVTAQQDRGRRDVQ